MNVVITHDTNFEANGCVVVHSIESALDAVKDHDEICVIGGADLYRQMLPYVNRIYMTIVHHTFSADTFFPELNLSEWDEVERKINQPDDKNKYACEFLILDKAVIARSPGQKHAGVNSATKQ
jgi:dihydrofolate reductase